MELVIDDINNLDVSDAGYFAVFVQNPDNNGAIRDLTALISSAHENDMFVVVAADLLSMVLAKSPGEMGAYVVV